MIDMNHPLVKLGQRIDREVFDREFGKHYAAKLGRPATRTRLIVGLTYLQFMYGMSDEAVADSKLLNRTRKFSNKLRAILGRVIRDIERKAETSNTALTARITDLLALAKGKARNPYEFGAKVSVAVTAKDGGTVGARTFKHNPYDGHTLFEAFDQIKAITDYTPKQVHVDRGFIALRI